MNNTQGLDIGFERCLWIAKMPSHLHPKLPASSPMPHLVNTKSINLKNQGLNRALQSLPGRHFIIPATSKLPLLKKENKEKNRAALIYTTPFQFKTLPWNEFISSLFIPDLSKGIAKSLLGLYPEQTSDTFYMLVQWYSLLRGHIDKLTNLGYQSIISRDVAWTSKLQGDWLTLPRESIHFEHNTKLYKVKLPSSLPVLFRELIQDAWISLQKLENCALETGQWRLACQHLSLYYRKTITLDKKVKSSPPFHGSIDETKTRANNQVNVQVNVQVNAQINVFYDASNTTHELKDKYKKINVLA